MPPETATPRINQIVLAPHRGHSDDTGQYDRGHDIGSIAEVDVLQIITQDLEHIFDDWGLRWNTLDVFRRPGVKYIDRPTRIEPQSLVLDLRCGWYLAPRGRNLSSIWFGHQYCQLLAERFQEALAEWGSCTNFGHRVTLPKLAENQPLIGAPNIHGIRLDVFVLNGPDVPLYLRRLRELARDLASVVVEYLRGKEVQGSGRGIYLK